MNDPLDDLLAPIAAPPDEALRREIFARTTRVLRRRRRVRQLGTVGLVAAVCAACLLLVTSTIPPDESTPPNRPVASSDSAPRAELLTPVALEWRALEQPDDAARFYRAAADGYLQEGDTTNATRCYANALDEGGAAALEGNTNDTWLFLVIKQARKKERDGCAE